jgi:DEAD/DEAH box helicase domain-containing protein
MSKPALFGQNIVVYDLETKNPVKGEVTWDRHDLMGISVGCLFDYKDGEFKVYMDDNLDELAERLLAADLVSGFNISGFDEKLLIATMKKQSQRQDLVEKLQAGGIKNYDLLYWSRRASGWVDGVKFPSGMRLDDHLLGTFGRDFMKTGDGARAPDWFQEGRIGRLVSYCLGDVFREKALFEHVWNGSPVLTANHGERSLRDPFEVLTEFKTA